MHPNPKAVRLRKLSHLCCALMKQSVFFWQGWIKKNQISVISHSVCVTHSFHFTSDLFPAGFFFFSPLTLSQHLAWQNTLKPSSKPISLVTLCLSHLADWWQVQSILCSQRAAGFGERVSVCSIIFEPVWMGDFEIILQITFERLIQSSYFHNEGVGVYGEFNSIHNVMYSDCTMSQHPVHHPVDNIMASLTD